MEFEMQMEPKRNEKQDTVIGEIQLGKFVQYVQNVSSLFLCQL